MATTRIAISGAGGLIGSRLRARWLAAGHEVARLVRGRRSAAEDGPTIPWDPTGGQLDADAFDGFDAVVHLAGESIAGVRWSAAKKRRIRESRVAGTRLLATALARCPHPPPVLICASAVGFYGDRGDTWLDEDSAPGEGFLAEVCQAWEAAADPAREAGLRVVHLRIGPVLATDGGALAQMLTPFRLGLGGVVGSGEQYMSWIAVDDMARIVDHALREEAIVGPLNAVAPHPATNREFTRALGRALGRPTVLPMPAFAARLAFGEVANELLLASARVDSSRLVERGFRFDHPDLAATFAHLLA